MKNYQKYARNPNMQLSWMKKIVCNDQTVANAIWTILNIHLEFEFGIPFQINFN